MATGYCPECDVDTKFSESPKKGMRVTCASCGAWLEVIATSPIELDWVNEEEDDYDDLDDFDDDDF